MKTKNDINQNYDPWNYSSDNVGYISKEAELNRSIQMFFADVKYDKNDEKIHFYNIKGEEVGSINVKDFPSSSGSNITNTDNSITITIKPTGTDIGVNIKSDEKVIKLGSDGIYTDIKISALTAAEIKELPDHANIKEAYKLLDSDGQQLGDVIKIYKESSLYNAYLGHVDDTLVSPEDPTVINGSGDTALCFIYQKSDDTYELVALNIAQFFLDLEFSSGLTVENNVVKVLVDPASETFLSVSSHGVKLNGVQNAIDSSISGTIQTLGLTSDSAITGQYIAAIEESNGIVGVKTRANVSEATLNNYTKGDESTKIDATDTINQAFSKLDVAIENEVERATSREEILQEAINRFSEQFLILPWSENLNVNVPPVGLDIDNTDIPKLTFKTSGETADKYQIVGMIAYEIFGADGKRLNYMPVCQFTGQGQTELQMRGCVMGTEYKTATKISAWVLLKSRS